MVFAIYKYQEVIVMLREIEKVLEEDVRPYLLEHEGNVRISEYKEGILKVRLTGQCSGCPSAALTTEELIAEAVKKKIPEVKDVVLVNEVSDDLIEMAKKLMSHSGKQGVSWSERLDAIIENSFDGIYITDGRANTIKVNRAYETITGLDRADMLGKNMEELERGNVISVSGSLMAIREKRVVTLEQEFKTGKKAVITSSPICDKEGQIIMVVTNVRDLTEIYHLREEMGRKKQEEEKLRQKLRHVQGEFFGSCMVAQDKNTLDALFWADKVSGLDATVMLLGETGVGKEEFARYI